MTSNQSNKKTATQICIIILSILGLMICIPVLFPPVRQMIVDLAGRILHREIYPGWIKTSLSYAMGVICFILFFDYCTLTRSGKLLTHKVKQEIKDCLSEIDFRSLLKPVLIMSGVYLLGIVTIIRANFSYIDDIGRATEGYREWHAWSRYISELSSIFIHGDTNLTDISPLPQLLAILILSISSVLLVYIIGNKKITVVRLLASIPLGLSPYFLECLSYKFDAPYMALSILASIVPFLFITRKKAFFFCSVASLLIMCMTYQAASGIYPMIVLLLCFRDWNSRKKPNKEILSFMGMAAGTFCFAILCFKIFLVKPVPDYFYGSNTIFPIHQIIPGTLSNIKGYVMIINQDLGTIWKVGIALVLFFFIIQSIHQSAQKQISSFFVIILIIGLSFIASYGVYSVFPTLWYLPRTLFGFGLFLAILCIFVVSDYKKIATITVLALNWCLFVFAFSYGNALADQARYAEFRMGMLLHDLSSLYPDQNREDVTLQIKNSIDYAPSVKNIAKHYPVIERLVPKLLEGDTDWGFYYFSLRFKSILFDPKSLDARNDDVSHLPVVLDSYYHTIQSDGERILVLLKH